MPRRLLSVAADGRCAQACMVAQEAEGGEVQQCRFRSFQRQDLRSRLYRYRYHAPLPRPRRHLHAGAAQILLRTARAAHAWHRADVNIHDTPRHAWPRPPARSAALKTFHQPNQHLHHNFCSTNLCTTSTSSTSEQTNKSSSTRTSTTPRASTRRCLHSRGTLLACCLAHCLNTAHSLHAHEHNHPHTTASWRERPPPSGVKDIKTNQDLSDIPRPQRHTLT